MPPPNAGDDRASATDIYGGERLGWDQVAPNAEDVRGYVFNLYVDDIRASLADVRCANAASTTGHECSGVLPALAVGTRKLQLSVTVDGRESERSLPLTVTVGRRIGPSAAVPSSQHWYDHPVTPSVSQTMCFDSEPRTCYQIERVAEGLGRITSLTPVGNGHLLFVENAQRVRVFDGDRVAPSPAFAVDRGEQVGALVAHPNYERTRTVYTAVAKSVRLGYLISVLRHRDVGGMFGETATVIADLFAASPLVPMTMSETGDLYLAFPGAALEGREGVVLRYREDGAVPRDATAASPLYAHGHDKPAALAALGSAPSLWMAGTGGLTEALAVVTRQHGRWPAVPLPLKIGEGMSVGSIAFLRHTNGSGTTVLFVGGEDGLLHRIVYNTADGSSPPSVGGARYTQERVLATSVAATPAGTVYVAVSSSTDFGSGSGQLLRLRPTNESRRQ